jgi:hypothetical protein
VENLLLLDDAGLAWEPGYDFRQYPEGTSMQDLQRPFPGAGPRPAGHGATPEDWMGGTLEEGVFDGTAPGGDRVD